ncbi:hypothetical protein [Roseovarius sp.]|uniref:hypothetical protein n=1 Tax=Roseovarius sp. TaxID=1486281 RepID=UPI003562A276
MTDADRFLPSESANRFGRVFATLMGRAACARFTRRLRNQSEVRAAARQEWILDDRPDCLVHVRYQKLVGRNWLTLENEPAYRNLPTELTKAAIGAPSHDLRMLAADYMRRHDPAHAADVIATHLGHGTRKAGEAYRAECEGATAEAIWQESRATIAAKSVKPTRKKSERSRAVWQAHSVAILGC